MKREDSGFDVDPIEVLRLHEGVNQERRYKARRWSQRAAMERELKAGQPQATAGNRPTHWVVRLFRSLFQW